MEKANTQTIDFSHTPFIVVNLDVAQENCRTMVENLKKHGIAWRPHIKTHKSVFFAKKQLEWGAHGITCATVGEAKIMAEAGFDDIYIAYPLIGNTKLAAYFALSQTVKTLRTLVNSLEGAMALGAVFEKAGAKAQVLLEIDGRFGRGGIAPDAMLAFAQTVASVKGIEIVGLASFSGAAGALMEEEKRREDAKIERDYLCNTAQILKEHGFCMDVLSGGSSVSTRYPDCLVGLTEARAGTCIFNDAMHIAQGTCTQAQAAATVWASVVTCIAPGRAIIDAGSKTLTSDLAASTGYGRVLGLGEGAFIVKLSEEHGFLEFSPEVSLSVGDVLQIIPNHICTAMNLADSVVCVQDGAEPFLVPVDARGQNR